MSDSINDSVIAKLKARAELGAAKYGVTMDRQDLSELDWLVHAQSEMLDSAVYLEKLIQLRRGPVRSRVRNRRRELLRKMEDIGTPVRPRDLSGGSSWDSTVGDLVALQKMGYVESSAKELHGNRRYKLTGKEGWKE